MNVGLFGAVLENPCNCTQGEHLWVSMNGYRRTGGGRTLGSVRHRNRAVLVGLVVLSTACAGSAHPTVGVLAVGVLMWQHAPVPRLDQSGGDCASGSTPSQRAGLRQRLADRGRGRGFGADLRAGLVLGIESVPDGLAQGLLAGVNPIFGLHGYMIGTAAGALATSSSFMAVQATGAMSIIIADVGAVSGADDPARALFTLAVLTGVVMLLAGLLKAGSLVRFVSNAVMVGFLSAVGVNIVLGQLDSFTGYEAAGSNRIARTLDLFLHPGDIHLTTLLVGVATIVLILGIERTPVGSLGLVVAVAITSAAVSVFNLDVLQLADIAAVPNSLPTPVMPQLSLTPQLIIPALSLAFVGLVQGAGISASFPNADGTFPDASRDFIGQGIGNVASGILQGMPVAGSMSSTSLVKEAGARTRLALFVTSAVMAVVIVAFSDLVEAVAMPALAGLLMIVGVRTVKPRRIMSVVRTGAVQATVLGVTFALTMLVPLQYAVLVGVGISMILVIVSRSNRIVVKRWEFDEGGTRETEPPEILGVGEVVVLQPYGSLFFASAPVFESLLPQVGPNSSASVVIVRLRGFDDLGSTFTNVLGRYASALHNSGSKLMIVSSSQRVVDQLAATGALDAIGSTNLYESDEWLGASLRRARDDALEWVAQRRPDAM